MSIINDFLKGKMHNLPNDVQNLPDIAEDGTKLYLGCHSLTWDARQRKEAIAKGIVKPSMAYSEEELVNNSTQGVWATKSTVESQLEQRESTPQ